MKDTNRLPDSELEIMQLIWRLPLPVSRGDIERAMGEEKRLAPTTILTLLTRLCDRGFLRQEKAGRGNVYTPLVSQREYLANESRGMLNRLFGGSVASFAASLCDSGVSREEIEELRELLERGKL